MTSARGWPSEAPGPGAAASRRARRRWRGRLLAASAAAVWLGVAYWQTHKPLPPGTHLASDWYAAAPNAVSLLTDLTAADAYGRPIMSQAIFDETLRIVRSAREFVVLDYFVLSSAPLRPSPRDTPAEVAFPTTLPLRAVAAELRAALITRKRTQAGLKVLVITDPLSELYGSAPSPDLAALKAAGIDVVVSDLDALRDPNFLYSSLWRIAVRWWSGGAQGAGWIPNPLPVGPAHISFRAWARLINFKANHRDLLIADDGHGGLVGVVSSAHTQTASSADSDVALEVSGPELLSLMTSELAVARFSGWEGKIDAPSITSAASAQAPAGTGAAVRVRMLTEGATRDALLEHIDGAGPGSSIDIAVLYLSDRSAIDALLAASRRGASVRLILDPNAAAFGRVRVGIPNQATASELVAASDGGIRVRWYRTHGERFHAALAMVYDAREFWLTAGSANLTRRSLEDYDLEANVALESARGAPLSEQARSWFDALWSNRAPPGVEYTADLAVFADSSQLLYWYYRLMEASGLATF